MLRVATTLAVAVLVVRGQKEKEEEERPLAMKDLAEEAMAARLDKIRDKMEARAKARAAEAEQTAEEAEKKAGVGEDAEGEEKVEAAKKSAKADKKSDEQKKSDKKIVVNLVKPSWRSDRATLGNRYTTRTVFYPSNRYRYGWYNTFVRTNRWCTNCALIPWHYGRYGGWRIRYGGWRGRYGGWRYGGWRVRNRGWRRIIMA